LRSAVPLVAIQEEPSSFAIFETFDDEAGRDAHLNGQVAAAVSRARAIVDRWIRAATRAKQRTLLTVPWSAWWPAHGGR
jgi:quinol monooxygenase YgiN